MTSKPYLINIAPRVHDQFHALSLKQQRKIYSFLEALSVNPRPPGSTKIEGLSGLYAEHIEHILLIYRIEKEEILILSLKA